MPIETMISTLKNLVKKTSTRWIVHNILNIYKNIIILLTLKMS